jgi:hypothetical protein
MLVFLEAGIKITGFYLVILKGEGAPEYPAHR